MGNLLKKLPVDIKDIGAVVGFAVAVILVVMVAKRLPIVGKQV